MDSAQVYSAELAPLLLEGERLACAVMVTYVSGQELGMPLPGISFDPVNGLSVGAWDAAAERLVGGVSLSGAPGSLARVFRDAIDGDANHVILTDRRVIAAYLGPREGRTLWQGARELLVGVTLKPRLLQRGRVALGFVDGSVLCLMAGAFSQREAKRLVEAV